MIFGALEGAMKGLHDWKELEGIIRNLVEFIGTKGHRNQIRGIPTVPVLLRNKLNVWTRMRGDFKWEKLEYQLDALLEVLPLLVESYDLWAHPN